MYHAVHTEKAAKKKLPFLYVLIIIIFGFLCYLNSFYNEFVWDDRFLILENPFIYKPNPIRMFAQDIYSTDFSTTLFYRPLQNLSYLVDHRIWGFNPFGYHITNTLLHTLNAILIFFLVVHITKDKPLSLLTSLFFVSHPIHYGVVTYLSGRADSLFTLFFLISFLGFIKYRENFNPRFLSISVGGFLLSLLSKEMAVISVFIFILYDLIFNPHTNFDAFRKTRASKLVWGLPYFAFGILLCTYGIFRLNHLREAILVEFPGGNLYGHILTFPKIVVEYIISLLAPSNLHMRKELGLEQGFLRPQVLISILVVFSVLTLGISLKKKNKAASFFIFYFLIVLLPVSNIVVKVNAIVADHWLYMPSIGYFFVLSYCLLSFKKLFGTELAGFTFGLCLIAVYSLITIDQNTYWKDDLTLFTEILKKRPNDPLVRRNLGGVYLGRGQTEKAMEEEKALIELFPDYAEGHCSLGITYFHTEHFEEAIGCFKNAIAKNRLLDTPHLYMGLIYERKENHIDAEAEFRKVIELSPYSAMGYVNMGILKYRQNEIDLAFKFFNTAIEKDPQNTTAYLYLSTIYRIKKEFIKAVELLEKAARIEPNNIGVLMDLGNMYINFGEYDKATASFRKALVISPDKSELYYNMGNAYRLQKDLERAKRYWMRALKIDPDFKEALESLKEVG